MKIKNYVRLIPLSVISGIICGLFGALFSHFVSFVTGLRAECEWLIYLLPLGGLLSVYIYRLLGVRGVGTESVFCSVTENDAVSPLLAPAVFAGSVITHLFGGSAGREGAALQLGGGVSSFIARIFKSDPRERQALTLCGMAAFFSAIFGTPIGAFVFVLEIIFSRSICLFSAVPIFFSSFSAFFIAKLLKVKPERFALDGIPNFGWDILWKVLLTALMGAAVSIVFCYALKYTKLLFKRVFKNEYLRILAGGALIALITLLLGTRDYNGAGVNIIERIFEHGEVKYEAFALKIILTALTVAAGYKGGEIIPTLFIGATFGATVALLLGFAPAMGAAVGMTALFCGVTNCPVAAVALSAEMFGVGGIVYFALAAAVSYVFSSKITLYSYKTDKFLK